jgi:hypothetical protein
MSQTMSQILFPTIPTSGNGAPRLKKLTDIMKEQEVYDKKIEELEYYSVEYPALHKKHLKYLRSMVTNFSKDQNRITELVETLTTETYWEFKKDMEMRNFMSIKNNIEETIQGIKLMLKSKYPNEYHDVLETIRSPGDYCCEECLFRNCPRNFVTNYKSMDSLYDALSKLNKEINILKDEMDEYKIKTSKYKLERATWYEEIYKIVDKQKMPMDKKIQYRHILMIGRQQDSIARVFFLEIGDTSESLLPTCWNIVFDYLRSFVSEQDSDEDSDQDQKVVDQSSIVILPDKPDYMSMNPQMHFILSSREKYKRYFSRLLRSRITDVFGE